MSQILAVMADLLVAVLLVATMTTSIKLSRRMARMKADESAMRSTIAELMVATDSAERAITALRATVLESERNLGERLNAAARRSAELGELVSAGRQVIEGAAATTIETRRRPEPESTAPASSGRDAGALGATILAARDVAARAARRLGERAA